MNFNDASAQKREAARNPRYVEVMGDNPAMQTWRRLSEEAFAPPRPEPRFLEKERRDFERDVARAIVEESPDLKARAAELLKKMRPEAYATVQPARHAVLSDHFAGMVVELAPPPPPDGFFWWAQTQPTGNAGINTEFLSDGLHFFGGIDYGGDDPLHRFVGAIATFELHAARRPPSSFGRWRSAPFVELFGQIRGFTGVKIFPIAMDDKWCKCFLNLRQTAFQLTAGGVKVLANRETNTTLLDEENNAGWNFRNLDGFTPMPMVEFGVADPALSVFVDLDVRFDIILEGDSRIVFVPGSNPMGSVLLRIFSWQVQAL